MPEINILPVIALRGMTAYPHMPMSFDIGRRKSIEALDEAMNGDHRVMLVAQQDPTVEDPTEKDLYTWGTVAVIKQVIRPLDDNIKVLVEGLYRAHLDELIREDVCLVGIVEPAESEKIIDRSEAEAWMRTAKDLFFSYAEETHQIPPPVQADVESINDPDLLADTLIMHTIHDQTVLQFMLPLLDPIERLERWEVCIRREMEMAKLEMSIQNRVQEQMSKYQKDAFLNEQMKVIRQELGQGDDEENARLREKLEKLPLPEESRKKVLDEMSRLERMPSGQPDANVSRTWLETVASLPWDKKTEDRLDLAEAEQILNEDHDGMVRVKERVLEYLAVHQLTDTLKGPILCLVGPPGVGKTSIARSVARCLGRKFVRSSLGGLRDEAELRGHRRTYIGAIPGRIIAGIAQADSSNPVFLLDEIDKMAHDAVGDPASAMLEILDGEQNFAFRDHYLDIPFDLSQVIFLATANSLETVPRPLLDRMEIIELDGYTDAEKKTIARNHLIPKSETAHGLAEGTLRIDEDALAAVITEYTREAGVRSLERQICRICRKAARQQVARPRKHIRVRKDALEDWLGKEKIFPNVMEKEPMLGMAVGLAYNSVGGDTLMIEVNVMPGTGQLILTGQLGDVMKESARAALTYIRARSEELGVEGSFYKEKDIHVHVPEGATPKDGPSAGVAITTALLSALTGKRVRCDLAMTGEVTLRGRILPIGGLREKLMAASRDGIRTVLIPAENERDLADLPAEILKSLEVCPVHTVNEALTHVFA